MDLRAFKHQQKWEAMTQWENHHHPMKKNQPWGCSHIDVPNAGLTHIDFLPLLGMMRNMLHGMAFFASAVLIQHRFLSRFPLCNLQPYCATGQLFRFAASVMLNSWFQWCSPSQEARVTKSTVFETHFSVTQQV